MGVTREIMTGNVEIGANRPLVLIAGTCVIENESATMRHAELLMAIFNGLSIPLIFKASYDKANRTSFGASRGPGLKKGLAIHRKAGIA